MSLILCTPHYTMREGTKQKVYMPPFVTFRNSLGLISLDYGAVYSLHLAVWAMPNSMCICKSSLGDRASEQLHRHN